MTSLRLITGFCLTLTAPAAWASAEYDASSLWLEQGVFCAVPIVDEMPAPGTAAGKIELFEGVPEFQWVTNEVPAVENISFGIKTEALDGRVYDNVILTLTHPEFRDSGINVQRYVTSLGGNGTSINAYSFDTLEEMEPGIWTFSATRDGELVYRASFRVVPPALSPEIAAACGGLPLS